MLQHELGALEVVDLTIWLDEVRAHFVDVIDDYEFVLLFIRTRRKIDEEPVILLNIVAVLDVDLLANHLVRHCLSMIDLGLLGRLSKKVVYMSQSDEISACRDDENLPFISEKRFSLRVLPARTKRALPLRPCCVSGMMAFIRS